LNKKNQKFKNPESLSRAVFRPLPAWVITLQTALINGSLLLLSTTFINFAKLYASQPFKRGGRNKLPEAIRLFLIFWFFLIKQKE
jgi:hypothetical protein